MKKVNTLGYLTSSIIDFLDKELIEFAPNIVIVQGDTTSAFAGALASFYLKIPIAHVEAGLRTNNLFEPFPEEANRRLISQLADMHFSPTKASYENLIKIGIKENIFITGNTVIDSLIFASKNIYNKDFFDFDLTKYKVILATIHRRENWGDSLYSIAKGIKKILDSFPETILLLPMHPNERVRKPLKEILENHPRAYLLEPFSYDKLVFVLKNSFCVLTDSGGLQEEAPAFGKPVLVIRNNTERNESIEIGTSQLVGTNTNDIFRGVESLLMNSAKYNKMSKPSKPFGDGNSSKLIFDLICKRLKVEF